MTKIRSRNASRVQDRRGQGGGGMGGLGGLNFPMGGGRGGGGLGFPIKAGGGVLGIVIALAAVFLPQLLGGGGASSVSPAAQGGGAVEGGNNEEACTTELEQILCGANESTQDYWAAELPAAFNQEYEDTQMVFFSGFTNTGCGQASAQTGPFYCPLDALVYFDLEFLQQLQEQFGATGDLAAQYIVAHEMGHHVQNVLGINAQVRQAQNNDPDRANQYSIALELQADCFAGTWARHVADEGLLDNAGEINEALDAAAAVGDDRIQEQATGRVDRDSWTHGSSEQRVTWFRRGFDTGDPARCNTFDEVL